jgi:hypothetical protein
MKLPPDLNQVVDMKIKQDVGKIFYGNEQTIAKHNFKKGAEFVYELMVEYEKQVRANREEEDPVVVEL